MTKASENVFPKLILDENGTIGTVTAGERRLGIDANGVLVWKDSAALTSPLVALNKWNATTAPAVTDDSGDGYAVGSRWIDTTNDKEYVALDVSVGAAVWTETTGGGSGSVATDAIWTTAGMAAIATGTATATEQWPPGHEFDYAQITTPATPNATSEATANTIITGGSVTYDGSTAVILEFVCGQLRGPVVGGEGLFIVLYDGSSSIGQLGDLYADSSSNWPYATMHAARRFTPSAAAHTYSIRAYVTSGSGDIQAGAGGSGNKTPAYMRIFKA